MPTVNPLCSIRLSAKAAQTPLCLSEQIRLIATAPRAKAHRTAILSNTHSFVTPDSCAHSCWTTDGDPQGQQQGKEPESSDDGQRTNSAPDDHSDQHQKGRDAERQSQVWLFHQQTECRGGDDDEHTAAAAAQDGDPVVAPPTGMRLATNHPSHLARPVAAERLVGRSASADDGLDLPFRRDLTSPQLTVVFSAGIATLEMLLFEVAVVAELHAEPLRTVLGSLGIATPATCSLHPRLFVAGPLGIRRAVGCQIVLA